MIRTRVFIVAAILLCTFGCASPSITSSASDDLPVRVSPDGVSASEPAMAAASDGTMLAIYVEHHDNDAADLFLHRLDSNGQRQGERTRVNDQPGTVKAWYGDPPTIAVGKDGTIFVGWTRKQPGAARSGDLVLSVSHDGGASFAAPVRINDDAAPASHGMHSLSVDPNGRIVMAWLDERNVMQHGPHDAGTMMHHDDAEPNSEVFVAASDDDGRSFSPNVRIASDACPCCKTSLMSAPDGRLYASWRQVLAGDHRHIAVAGSADGGKTFSTASIVSDDNWQLSSCPVSGAALYADAGRLDVLWYTAGEAGPAGIYFSHSEDGGRTFSQRQLIDQQAKSGTPVLLPYANSLTAVFNSKEGGVYARKLAVDNPPVPIGSLSDASAASACGAPGGIALLFTRASATSPSVWFQIVR